MRIYIIAWAMCIIGFSSIAQTLRGRVVDAKGEVAPFATIALLKSTDSVLVKATLTDVEGNYLLENIKHGSFRISVSMIGYEPAFSVDFTLSKANESFEIPTITIKEASQLLGEVQIVEKKALIVQEAGKTVVNVENSIVASGGLMASDVLKRTPGVVMDNDGNISLKGKSNVLLLIDGKPTYLSAKQAFAILKGIPSSQIASIEIITAPSAKYDAQGNAGVINIIMKKGFAMGWNGNLHTSYGQGYYPKFNLGGGISWGGKKFSFNTIYDFTANRDFNRFYNDRNFGLISNGNRMIQDQNYIVPSMSHTVRANADWDVNTKLKLGVVGRVLTTEDRWIGNSTSEINDKNGIRLQNLLVKDNNPNFMYDIAGGANGVYKFDTLGHKISADVDISSYNQSSIQQSTTEITSIGGTGGTSTYDFKADLPTKVDIFTAKTDYTKPISTKLNLEAGLKYVNISVLSKIGYTFGTGFPTSPFLTGGTFNYKESIAAAYANLNYTLEKWSLQGGLRAENWSVRGQMQERNITVRRDSLLLFPSALVKYKINKDHELGLSYNSRIDRPNYRTINPIAYYGDPYNYFVGNPSLKPQFTHHFELSHTAFEGALVTTLNYTRTNQYIFDYTTQQISDSSDIQYMGPSNLPKFENMGLSVSLYYPITKFWTCQVYVNGYQNRLTGTFGSSELNLSQWAALINTVQSFTLPNQWSIEASGLYISPTLDGYMQNRAMGMVSAGVQKGFWNNIATLKLAVQDAFYTFIFRGKSEGAGVNSTYSYQWDNRTVNLTFTYKFGLKNLVSGEEIAPTQEKLKGGGR